MRFRSLTRSIAALSIALMLLLAAFARPALAQSPDVTPAAKKTKGPLLEFSTKALNFGKVVVDTTSPAQTVTVTNGSSTIAVTITNIAASPPFVETNTCDSSIAPSGVCHVDVSLKPTAVNKKAIKNKNGLTFNDSALKSPQHVELEGQGIVGPTPTATATATATPTATATATRTATVRATPTATSTGATASATPTSTPTGSATVAGTIQGGLNPISGSSITVYAAGTTGYGSAPATLATGSSAADGSFSIGYNPPPSPTLLYVVATGGNAGLGANSAIALVGILGMSNSSPATSAMSNSSPATPATINELTTMAAAWSMAPFFKPGDPSQIGTTSTNVTGLANAVSGYANLVAISTGKLGSFMPAAALCLGGSPPVNCHAEESLNEVADLLAACVASSGPSASFPADCSSISGSSPACDQILCYAGQVTDTLRFAATVALNPVIVNPNSTQTLPTRLVTGSSPFQPVPAAMPNDLTLSLNFSQTGGGGVGIAVDAFGDVWFGATSASIGKLSPAGALLSPPGGYTGGGLNTPNEIAIDTDGNAWVANQVGSVSKFSSDGTPQSPSTGYTGGGLDGSDTPSIDGLGHVWVSNKSNSSITELNSLGAPISGLSGFTGGGLDSPHGVAVDSAGHVWAGNGGNASITELSSTGSPLSPSSGFTGGGLDNTHQIAFDPLGNLWAANKSGNSISEFNSSGSPLSGSSGFVGGGLESPNGIAVDSSGHVFVGDQASLDNGTTISEFANNGTAISPSTGFVGAGLNGPHDIAIDTSGNLWVNNDNGNSVTEFIGIAAPVKTPLIGLPMLP